MMRCVLILALSLLAVGCAGSVSGSLDAQDGLEEPAGNDGGDPVATQDDEGPDASVRDEPQTGADEPASFDDGGTALDQGADEGQTPCQLGVPPTLGNVTAVALHEELEAKDFLLINVASAPSIAQTDAVIGYSDTAALVDFIGPDLETRVVLYCQSGGRSTVAGNALVALGYCQIRQLAGGKTAWANAGYPLE